MTRSGSATAPPAGRPQSGSLTASQFLKRHWQRRPLLMRQASFGPRAEPLVDPGSFTARELFALARNPDVESRLVHAPAPPAADHAHGAHETPETVSAAAAPASGRWRLRHGPFQRLPSLRQAGWSLLVQGVDLHLPAGRALMDRFRFLPDARLDDLMISFATDGGGVGPHVDSYDVFLLQVHGTRRWRIVAPRPAALLPDAPLKILADFEAEQSCLLEPGDMLYLPPGWAHEGTAVGDCMTCSIGFRSPSVAELRQAFFSFLADQDSAAHASAAHASALAERRYRDKTREPVRHPAQIPGDMADTLRAWLEQYQPPAQLIDRFIGCYLTEPKPSVWFDGSQPQDRAAPAGAGVVLDAKTRMLYRRNVFYINGEPLAPPASDRPALTLLRALADQRGLNAVQAARALRHPWLRDRLEDWLACGWIRHANL